MRLTGIAVGDVAILNVYAPNLAATKNELWVELIGILPNDCRWLFAGNWNFIEREQDKSKNNNQTMSAKEKRMFELLKLTFDVYYPFPFSNQVRYS
jgi:hypothetical protein